MIMVVLLIFLLCTPVRAGKSLIFCTGGSSVSQVSLAILEAAYDKLGIAIVCHRLPAARSLDLSSSGQHDGELNRIEAIEEDYPTLIRIPVPINRLEGVGLTWNRTIDTTNPPHIGGHHIGIKIGNVYAEKLTRNMPRVTRMIDEHKLLKALKANRLEILVIDRTWATQQLGVHGNEQLHLNEPALVTIPLYHYLHEHNRDLVADITRILETMRDSGEMERIRAEAYQRYTTTQ